MTMEVGPGPGAVRKPLRSHWHGLADSAMANRGEWVSMPLGKTAPTAANSTLYRLVAIKLGVEVVTQDGTVYVRVPE